MNDRIKELKQQAIDYAWSFRNEENLASLDDIFQAKFAELIVKECVSACYKQTPNWKGEYATAFGDGIEFCISGIKEHFGVE
jgi:hypothetical protein